MTTKSDLALKNEVLKCSSICGGITGKTMYDLGCSDNVIRELCESKRLKKVPVQILDQNGDSVRITVFEDQSLIKTRRNYACITAGPAALIWQKNKFYLENRDIAIEWFDDLSIESHCKALSINIKDRPGMMLYTEEGLVGVYFCKAKKTLTDEEIAMLKEKYMLDKCVVRTIK